MSYALLSVTDKEGIGSFAKGLVELGYKILSTGGTLRVLLEEGIDAVAIDQYTGFPEMLDGRVKTLHPKVHGGLLYRRDLPEHVKTTEEHGIESIDLVCINLYEFEKHYHAGHDEATLIENIDIGGPSMIRSGAKNFKDVLVVTSPADYGEVLDRLKAGTVDYEYRRSLAMKAFSLTAYYDGMISRYFQKQVGAEGDYRTLALKKVSELRYGENPHQGASLYADPMVESYLTDFEQLQGKELSYNNFNDMNTAIALAGEFDELVCVGLKHATPCGVALGESPLEAYTKMFEADPVSIFGGIVAINGTVDGPTAEKMAEIFLEVVAAEDYTEEALKVLSAKKNLRLLKVNFGHQPLKEELRMVSGKVLIQDADVNAEEGHELMTEKSPTEGEKRDMDFGMKVVKYVRSNAVVLVKDGVTLGIGGGETSRIWALENIFNHNPQRDFKDSVLASDAFFPFDDCVRLAASKGVSAVVQPGGSIRDEDSVKACNEHGMSMVATGVRHFKH
ncbi:MAG: bifunctional phosphoribosylaminoimidazolecarboxamide formyltransferase/IMP cyclohydrolase [Tissierellia bacterium]|nr:bifunctional phosphoribosylaminoimidazolecarboxamide formyltransferase/IMP cyclohydrolase [Tissierellia bacterium]